MSHIVIQNRGELPIWGMRLLGLSTKTEDQIGQFGTGLKESIALMCRMGLAPIIYSGECRIDFEVQEFDGQQEICFKLSKQRARFAPDEWHGLGMHPNFGQADWDDPWMIFREVMCNAIDESGVEDLHHDVTSHEPSGVEGATRVYIPITPQTMEAYGEVHNRLLMLEGAEVLTHVVGAGGALKKRKKKPLQIYYRGVWVQEASNDYSLFDYEVDGVKLNESRSCDWWSVNNRIAKIMIGFSKEQCKTLLLLAIKNRPEDGKMPYEIELCQNAANNMDVENGQLWKESFEEIFGQNAVVTDNDKFYYDRISQTEYEPVIVMDSGLRSLLKAAGCKEPSVILTHEMIAYEEVRDPTDEEREVFDASWNKLFTLGVTNGKNKPPLQIFKPKVGGSTIKFGEYRNGVCLLNESCLGSEHEQLTCLEEIGHHVSGEADFSRGFQCWIFGALHASIQKGVKA